jgi:hypothetical protein
MATSPERRGRLKRLKMLGGSNLKEERVLYTMCYVWGKSNTKLLETYPERLTAVITVKCDSNMY